MSTPATIDQDSLFYLYLESEWAGPFKTNQIRKFVSDGQVAADAYAYDPTQQRHYMVEELIAQSPSGKKNAAAVETIGAGSSSITMSVFDDVVDIAPAQAPAAFDHVAAELNTLYQAYLDLTEHRSADLHQAAQSLHKAHQAVSDLLAQRQSDDAAFGALINQIDEVADYLANRHQIPQLWQLLSELEKIDFSANQERAIDSATRVLACIVERAERHQPAIGTSDGSLLDPLDDEEDSIATRKILLSARSEVQNTKKDIEALQTAYSQLQQQHTHDLEKAKKLLDKAEKIRAEERHASEQTVAELRALAAEIHRLASEADVSGGADAELMQEVATLGAELRDADPSTLAYLAEDVLIRMVARLRELAHSPEDAAPLRAELIRLRADLTLAKEQVATLTAECEGLTKQCEQERLTAERASARARDREHRLRSTVTALEVTKELHQEVMKDLQEQLRAAQAHVEVMEHDLSAVRGEMKGSSGTLDERGKALQDEMQRMVETRAMLEVRRQELSLNLKSAEAELAKAQSGPANNNDLAEALAAKINHLRQAYEATKLRLDEQEGVANKLEHALAESRREADQLRGRGDQLSGELAEARSGLTNAKKRVEELDHAYRRLEAEREALQQELVQRKSTDTIRKKTDSITKGESAEHRLDALETQLIDAAKSADSLTVQLAAERRKVLSLAEAQVDAQGRIEELTAQRDELRKKFEYLQAEHLADHARHTAAIAAATQAAIEAERRVREMTAQIADLEALFVSHESGAPSPDGERLRRELDDARAQHAAAQTALASAQQELASRATSAATGEDRSRLTAIERDLASAVAARDEIHTKLMQTVTERDRLRRDLDRLRNEHESAAVEHRAALKSARDRLTDTQEQVAAMEKTLAEARERQVDDADKAALQAKLNQALAEQERLSDEVKRHARELERVHAGKPAEHDHQLLQLAKASHQLASEQERVLVLNRSLMEALQAAETARNRSLELQAQLNQQTSERERLHLESERLSYELNTVRAQTPAGGAVAEHERTLAELARVNQELSGVRGRLAQGERDTATLERLAAELARVKILEAQLAELRSEAQNARAIADESRARLAQVTAERDRLAAELAQLRTQPSQHDELKTLRRRLLRAKRQIHELRAELAASQSERSAGTAVIETLNTQIERMRNAQRAAAEALGAPLPAGHESAGHGSGSSVFATAATNFAVAAQPGVAPATQQMSRSTSRRLMAQEPRPFAGGFTSAFGKPSIPTIHGEESFTAGQAQTRLTSVHVPTRGAAKRWRIPRSWQSPGRLGVAVGAAVFVAGFLMMPPLIPYSVQGVVNAKVIALKAPIEGQLAPLHRVPGDTLGYGETLSTIRNDHPDTSTLDGLTAKRAVAAGKRIDLAKDLQDAERQRKDYAAQLEDYHRRLVEDFSKRLADEAQALNLRKEAAAHTADAAAAKAVETEAALVDSLTRQVEKLRSGQFDSADEPLAGQRLKEIDLRLVDLHHQDESLANEIAELDRKSASEETRVNALRQAIVVSPIGGPLWKREAGDGAWVKAGDELALIADPSTIEVEAIVNERYVEDIAIGDAVSVHLLSEKREVRGTVRALHALDEAAPDHACSLTSALANRFKVVVTLDAAGKSVNLGQGVKLIVLGQNPSMIRRALAWMYEKTKL